MDNQVDVKFRLKQRKVRGSQFEREGLSTEDVLITMRVTYHSHTGRRTFICNALAMGIPPQVIMKWTGHSDYKAMKPYILIILKIDGKDSDYSAFLSTFATIFK